LPFVKGSSREKSGTNFGAFGAGFCAGFCTFGGGGGGGAAVTEAETEAIGCADGAASGGGGGSGISEAEALPVALALALGEAVAAGSIVLARAGRLARTVSTTAVPAIVNTIATNGATTYGSPRHFDPPSDVVRAPCGAADALIAVGVAGVTGEDRRTSCDGGADTSGAVCASASSSAGDLGISSVKPFPRATRTTPARNGSTLSGTT
jgi:hypothetical protein